MSGIVKVIPLESVRDVLAFARVRRVRQRDQREKPLGRCAAYTQNPNLNIGCREAMRGHGPHPLMRSHFSPMSRGELTRLLSRMRCERGLAEVRRTWGAGLRAMQAEFADGVMR